jgi:hypothetical protein
MRLLIGSARRYARGASELLALVSLPSPPDLYELSATFITVLRAASELKSAIDRTRKGGGSPTDGWPHPAHNPLLVIYHRFTHMMGEIESVLAENGLSWPEVGLSREVGTECILPVIGGDGPWIEVLLRPESLWRPLFEREGVDAIDNASATLEQACRSILEEPSEPIRIGRLKIEPLTGTIRLGGKRITIEHAASFQAFLRIARAEGMIVRAAEIREIPGCQGRVDLLLKRHLPAWVQELIPAQKGPGGGWALRLPKSCAH